MKAAEDRMADDSNESFKKCHFVGVTVVGFVFFLILMEGNVHVWFRG